MFVTELFDCDARKKFATQETFRKSSVFTLLGVTLGSRPIGRAVRAGTRNVFDCACALTPLDKVLESAKGQNQRYFPGSYCGAF